MRTRISACLSHRAASRDPDIGAAVRAEGDVPAASGDDRVVLPDGRRELERTGGLRRFPFFPFTLNVSVPLQTYVCSESSLSTQVASTPEGFPTLVDDASISSSCLLMISLAWLSDGGFWLYPATAHENSHQEDTREPANVAHARTLYGNVRLVSDDQILPEGSERHRPTTAEHGRPPARGELLGPLDVQPAGDQRDDILERKQERGGMTT